MSTTIVNTPPPVAPASENNGMGFLIGAIILIVFGVLFFYFVFPSIRQMMSKGIQINLPSEVSIPAEVNVNVEQPKQ